MGVAASINWMQRPRREHAKLHPRFDRTAIAYRTWLRTLGLTFGTA